MVEYLEDEEMHIGVCKHCGESFKATTGAGALKKLGIHVDNG